MKYTLNGIAVGFCCAGGLLFAPAAFAQSPGSQPQFEVASVKPAPPGTQRFSMDGGPLPVGPFNQGSHDPGRITWTGVWLMRVLQVAYDLPANRISGPAWLNTERYNIAATLPTGTNLSDFRLMLQNLLMERFRLAAHRETRELPGYVLKVAANGPKLTPSNTAAAPVDSGGSQIKKAAASQGNPLMTVDASGFPAPRPGNSIFLPGAPFEATINVNGRYRATVLNETVEGIAAFLGNALGAPVQDKTGLNGKYDVHLEYVPPPKPDAAATPGIAPGDPGPDVFAAVETQLGLKLISAKVPVELLLIDHAEKVPTEN